MADVILNVGFKFEANDVDSRAIRETITRALTDFTIKVSKAQLTQQAKGQVSKSVQDAAKNTAVEVKASRSSLERVRSDIRSAFTIPTLSQATQSQLQQFIRAFSQDTRDATVSVQRLRAAQDGLSGAVRGPTQIRRVGGVDPRQIAEAVRQVRRFGSVQEETSERVKRKQVRDIQEVERIRRNAFRQAERSRALFDRAAQRSPEGQFASVSRELEAAQNPIVRNTNSLRELVGLYSRGGISAEQFGAKIGQVTARFGAYLLAIRAVFAVQQAFNESLQVIFNFDSAIQDLNKVLGDTPEQLAKTTAGIFNVAEATGQGFEAVTQSLQTFVRQGLGSVDAALERTQAALIAVNVSELTVDEATKLITSTLRIFKDDVTDANQALDILSITSDNAATSAGEVGRAILRSGAAAKAVGVNFNQLNALIAATIEQTQISGSTIGAALKTIFSRLVTNTDAIREQINALGGQVKATDTVFDTLRKLAEIFPGLNEQQRGQLAFAISGRRRFTELAGILQSFGKTEELLGKQLDATGTAARKNEEELEKLSTRTQIVQNNLARFIATLAGVDEGADGTGAIRSSFDGILRVLESVTGSAADFVTEIRELTVLGVSASGIFTSIGKTLIFTAGVRIVGAIIRGFRQVLQIGNALARALGVSAQNVNANAQGIRQTNIAARQWQQITDAILRTKRGITNETQKNLRLERQAATGGASSGQTRGALGNVGAGLLRDFALVAGLTQISDELLSVANDLQETGEASVQTRQALLRAASEGINTAATLSLIFGPAVGLAAGAISNLVETFSQFNTTLKETTQLQRSAQPEIISLAEVFSRFGEAGLDAASELTGFRSGIDDLTQTFVSVDAVLGAQARRAAESIGGLSAAVDRVSALSESVVTQVTSAIAQADFANEIQKFRDAAVEREVKLNVTLESGPIDSALQPFIDSIARAASQTEPLRQGFVDSLGVVSDLVRAQEIFNATANQSGQSLIDILRSFGALPDSIREADGVLMDLGNQFREQTSDISASLDSFMTIGAEQEKSLENLKAQVAEGKALNADGTARRDLEADLARLTANNANKVEDVQRLTQGLSVIQAQLVELEEKRNTEALKFRNTLLSTSTIIEQLRDGARAFADSLAAGNVPIEASNTALRRQVEISNNLIDVQENITSFADQNSLAVRRLTGQIDLQVDKSLQNSINALSALRTERDRLAQGGVPQSILGDIDQQITRAQALLRDRREALTAQLQLEIEPQLNETLVRQVQEQEARLTQVRLRNIQTVSQVEQTAIQRRIDLFNQIGDSAMGLEEIERVFGEISVLSERTFGRLGGQIVRAVQDSAAVNLRQLFSELDAIPLQNLTDRFNKQIEIAGAEAEQTQRVQNEARQQILGQINNSLESVNNAEQQLLTIRNQVPQANGRVIESSRALAQAQANVDNVTEQLFSSYQAAADATADYALSIGLATASIRRDSGTTGVQGALNELRTVFINVTNAVASSAQKIREIRAQIAQAEISILQSTFSSIESLALNAATATQEQLNEQRRAIEAAQQIVRTGNTTGISQDVLQSVGSSIDALENFAPGLRDTLREIGATRLGIDPSTFDNLESQIIRLTEISLETGRSQIDAANKQVQASQNALVEARRNSDDQRQNLRVAQEQRQILANNLGTARATLNATRAAANRNVSFLTQQLNELQNISIFSSDMVSRLDEIKEALNNQEVVAPRVESAITNQSQQTESTGPEGLDSADNAAEVISELKLQTVRLSEPKPEEILRNSILADLQSKGGDLNAIQDRSLEQLIELQRRFEGVATATESQTTLQELVATNTSNTNSTLNEGFNLLNSTTQGVTNAINDLTNSINRINSGASVNIPNNARGSLTSGEINGLINAARNEKRLMPGGSRLMLANTSEVVLTNKQAKSLGIRPIPKAFAQDGNADLGGLQSTAAALNTAVNAIMARLDAPGFVQQNIDVNIDSERRVTVNAGQVSQAISNAFQQQSQEFVLREEQQAVNNMVDGLITELSDLGIISPR